MTREVDVEIGRPPLVVVVRDPDSSNDYRPFGGQVEWHDIDAGVVDLRDPEDFREWRAGHYEEAARLEARGYHDAAAYIRSVVDGYEPGC